MSYEQSQATRSSRSSTTSSTNSGYSSGGWLELTHTPRDEASSVSSTSTTFLPLTTAIRPAATRNITEEERRLFLLRARNGN